MEIVSYVVEGAIEHKDSLGTGSIIRPGDVQRMTAGTGVRHSEFNPSATEPLHFLQIWILPAAEGLAPSYEQRTFAPAERRGRWRLVASPDGREGSVTVIQLLLRELRSGQRRASRSRRKKGVVQVVARAISINGTRLKRGRRRRGEPPAGVYRRRERRAARFRSAVTATAQGGLASRALRRVFRSHRGNRGAERLLFALQRKARNARREMAQEGKRGSRDVALLYAPTDDGKGARILRSRDGNLEAGEVRPAKEGQPLQGAELVRLEPRPDAPCVCDVQVLHEAAPRESSVPLEAPTAGLAGRPAQVATEDYRLNWDRVFGGSKRAKPDTSLN
jgi:redox-sensitive bicupin YhaK (pirin superfamily)